MQKSFSLFLRQLHLSRNSFRESDILKSLTQDDFEELKNLDLLKRGSDSTHVICESCDDSHAIPVKYDGKKPYAACISDSIPNYLKLSEIRRWKFDVYSFLQGMTVKLGINEEIEALEMDGLWNLGTFTKDDTRHICYFFQGKDFVKALKFIRKQPSNLRRYVVITCKQELNVLAMEHELLLIEVTYLVDLQSGNLKFSKKVFDDHLTSGFRNVNFDATNGDLSANGEVIVSITPSTPEFYFTELLWRKFNSPQSHQGLVNHIYKKTGKEYDDPRDKVCHKMKRKVKEGAEKSEIIDQIFKTTKDENGENSYIMKNPA